MLLTEQTKNLKIVIRLIHQSIHIHVKRYLYQLIGIFCDRLKFGSTAALDCRTTEEDVFAERLIRKDVTPL